MAKFGLACEGITDQIVIENILCGFYKDYDDLDEEIQSFEPLRDETDKRQEKNSGGWTRLFTYLREYRFRDDVLNSKYTVVQIDTDVSDDIGFDVFKNGLTIEELIDKIIKRLIVEINYIDDFYTINKNKIIFAISVHSLECWLLAIYKKDEINNCLKRLQREEKKINVIKNYTVYDKLSRPFLKHKDLMKIIPKNKSFEIFINSLPFNI